LTYVKNAAIVIFQTAAVAAAQVWYDSDVNTDAGGGAWVTQLVALTGVTAITTLGVTNFA
jgi:hypothetical protein